MTVTTYWPPQDYAKQYLSAARCHDTRWSAKTPADNTIVVRLSWIEAGWHATRQVRWAVWYDRRFLGLFDRRKDALADAEHAAKLAAKRARPTGTCPGAGRPWGSGTGAPICPVCHRGPRALGAIRPRNRSGRWTGTVPTHPARTS